MTHERRALLVCGRAAGGMRRHLPAQPASRIAVSEGERTRLAEHGVRPRKLVVIPNGLDLAAFPPAPGVPDALSPPSGHPFTVAFLGRLTEEKGVRILLEAVERLSEASDLRFVMAGDGPLRTLVENAARRAGSRLEYLGYRADVLPVYHGADAVVIPSLSEGHP